MTKKLAPPRKLTAADYEWEPWEPRGHHPRHTKYTTSRVYADEGAFMYYHGHRKNGRFVVTFEGGRVGPANGYTSPAKASAAIARAENTERAWLWRQMVAERRKRNAKA